MDRGTVILLLQASLQTSAEIPITRWNVDTASGDASQFEGPIDSERFRVLHAGESPRQCNLLPSGGSDTGLAPTARGTVPARTSRISNGHLIRSQLQKRSQGGIILDHTPGILRSLLIINQTLNLTGAIEFSNRCPS